MGIVRKQSTKNLIYLYIGLMFGATSVVILYPNVFNENPQNLGLLQIIIAYATVISTFSYLGSPKVLLRFFPLIENKNKLISLVFYISTFGFLLFGLIFFFFKDFIFAFIEAPQLLINNYYLVFFMIIYLSYYEILFNLSRSILNATFPLFLSEIFRKGTSIILLLLLWANFISFNNFLILYISQYLLMSILLFFNIRKSFKFSLVYNFSGLNIGEIFKYGLFVLVGGASAMLVSKLDMMMIAKFLSLEDVAFYTIAFYMGNVIGVPARAIGSISAPLIAISLKENDILKIKNLYVKSSLNQLIIGSLLFLLVWLNIDDLFMLLPEKFQGGKVVVLFIGLSQLFNISTGVNGLIITNSKFYSFDLYANIFLLFFTLFTNYIFIPDSSPLYDYGIYGIDGAAFATSLSILLFNLIKMIFVYLKLKIQPFSLQTIYTIILAFLIFFIVSIFNFEFHNIINILIRTFCVLILYILCIYNFNISKDLKNLMKDFISYK